jgi:hypothetical protein
MRRSELMWRVCGCRCGVQKQQLSLSSADYWGNSEVIESKVVQWCAPVGLLFLYAGWVIMACNR